MANSDITPRQRIVITVEFILPEDYDGDWRDDPLFHSIAEAVPDHHPIFGDPYISGGLETGGVA